MSQHKNTLTNQTHLKEIIYITRVGCDDSKEVLKIKRLFKERKKNAIYNIKEIRERIITEYIEY